MPKILVDWGERYPVYDFEEVPPGNYYLSKYHDFEVSDEFLAELKNVFSKYENLQLRLESMINERRGF